MRQAKGTSVAKAGTNFVGFMRGFLKPPSVLFGTTEGVSEKHRFSVAMKGPGLKPADFMAIIRGAGSPTLPPSRKDLSSSASCETPTSLRVEFFRSLFRAATSPQPSL